MNRYSAYDTKARFSEVLRQVRSGETVQVTYHGEVVAELRPASGASSTSHRQRDHYARLIEEKTILPTKIKATKRSLPANTPRQGALQRFLRSRD